MDNFKGHVFGVKYKIPFFSLYCQVMSGCDCCVVNGELVEDKHIFERLGKTYGKIDN